MNIHHAIRQETLSRIETGRHTASRRTIDKVMQVMEAKRCGK